MLLAFFVALVGQAPDVDRTPNGIFTAAALDLTEKTPPNRRQATRYLSLQAVPEKDRESFSKALVFALNSTSFRSLLVDPPVFYGGLLVKVDLESLGWDRPSREAKLARLELSGVKFGFKTDGEKAAFLDPWEEIGRGDPYFRTTQENAGKLTRGWINPSIENSVRNLTYSTSFIARADWVLPRLLLEKQDSGFYSQLLMFPPNEADLYKSFGVDINFVDRENQLKRGGAVLESIVARHNRELQQIPSLFGHDERFIWRTFDVATEDTADKSVVDNLAGSVKHDGREIIGTLANGLHWYYLADATGKQVNVVPQTIALDMRDGGQSPIRDRNVINAYKCIGCHGPAGGTYPFADIIGKAILDPAIGLLVLGKDKAAVADKKQTLEEYYLSPLGKLIARQQDSYTERVKATNGLDSAKNADQLVGFINTYHWDLVGQEQAAREMGEKLDTAVQMWRRSGNNNLILLAAGQPIRRSAWERSVGDGMRAKLYTWEKAK